MEPLGNGAGPQLSTSNEKLVDDSHSSQQEPFLVLSNRQLRELLERRDPSQRPLGLSSALCLSPITASIICHLPACGTHTPHAELTSMRIKSFCLMSLGNTDDKIKPENLFSHEAGTYSYRLRQQNELFDFFKSLIFAK